MSDPSHRHQVYLPDDIAAKYAGTTRKDVIKRLWAECLVRERVQPTEQAGTTHPIDAWLHKLGFRSPQTHTQALTQLCAWLVKNEEGIKRKLGW